MFVNSYRTSHCDTTSFSPVLTRARRSCSAPCSTHLDRPFRNRWFKFEHSQTYLIDFRNGQFKCALQDSALQDPFLLTTFTNGRNRPWSRSSIFLTFLTIYCLANLGTIISLVEVRLSLLIREQNFIW